MLGTVVDYIARTNLFNFIIFASIIAYIFIKLDVLGIIEQGKNEVNEKINASSDAKNASSENLNDIEKKLSELGKEIDNIIKTSTDNANIVGEKIIEDANKTIEVFQENSAKLIENKTQLLRNELLRRASLASVEVARNHIKNELNNNADLHNKLIYESLEELKIKE